MRAVNMLTRKGMGHTISLVSDPLDLTTRRFFFQLKIYKCCNVHEILFIAWVCFLNKGFVWTTPLKCTKLQ